MRILRLTAAAAAPILLLGWTAPAWADDVSNDVATVVAGVKTMNLTGGGTDGTTTLKVSPANSDGVNGCNLKNSNSLTVSVTSSDPAVATVSPSSITLTTCGDHPTITVHPLTGGTSSITLAQTANNTGGTFNLGPATFNAVVGAAPNTAPTVTVSGASNGDVYNKGSEPTVTCDVADAEDGPSSFGASLSAFTGPSAADGIGSQTATCDHTDAGGLSDSDSVTYDIVDPSKPSITYGLTPATPDGANGWWTSAVDLDWTDSDAESPLSLSTTDCGDLTLSGDQAATAYTCSADSAGGHESVTTEDIKIDGTKPSIDSVDSGPTDGATYYFGLETVPAAPTCTASDATSGVNGDGCVVTDWSDQLGSHTATVTATDNAGNVQSQSAMSYDVVECNGDTSAVGTVCAPKCNGELATIKGTSGGPILGTTGDDVIVGTLGDDTIDGQGGDDTICGLDGADTIDGSDGADVVLGGTGADTVNGGIGNDIVRGGTDDDTLNGDADNDTMKGEGGNDTLNGGDGADALFGLVGNDEINGDAGNDNLVGASGVDTINGGADADTLNAGVGNDTLNGGDGIDRLLGYEGLDTMNGGDGADNMYGGLHADTMFGGNGDDFMAGGEGDDELHGEADNDTLNGNAGADVLDGGAGENVTHQ